MNIKVLTSILKSDSIPSDSAISGKVAIEMIKERIKRVSEGTSTDYYKLILLDYSMPLLDGPATSRLIRTMMDS
jgi:CheY-like chemotaxis protein